MAEEENKEEVDLGEKLEKLVEEIKEVMERRKERIAELRAEIERIEQDNVSLENTIGELLIGFYFISPHSLLFHLYRQVQVNKLCLV